MFNKELHLDLFRTTKKFSDPPRDDTSAASTIFYRYV
jgi:hypothetical protein